MTYDRKSRRGSLSSPEFLTDAPRPGREPFSPPPGPAQNGLSWARLGRAGRDALDLSLVIALGCLLALLLASWWLP